MQSETALVILVMALVTYATRAGGIWLMQTLPKRRFLVAWLRHLPGPILVAMVAPMVLEGPVELLAAVITFLIAWRTASTPAALMAGLIAVAAMRLAGT